MRTFLRPAVFKIIFTLILFLIILGTPLFYLFTTTITENGFQPPNLPIKVLMIVTEVIYYPIRIIIGLIPIKVNLITYQTNPLMLLFPSVISLILTFLESYLIISIISALLKKWMGNAKAKYPSDYL